MRKLLYFFMILGILLLSLTVAVAQDVDANWCNPGGPWDDGRCNNPNPYIASYYWEMGWCMAHNIDPESMMAGQAECTAVCDSYSKDDLKSFDFNYIPASEGLLANDLGEGVQVIDYTKMSRGGDLVVWADGSFSVKNAKPGEHKFTYTVTGGATAEVTLHFK